MRTSVLRHKVRDDTWAWMVSFGLAVIGTVTAVTYLVALICKLLFAGFRGDDFGASFFRVPWTVFAGMVGLTLYFVVWAWMVNRVGKRRPSVQQLMARVGASSVVSAGDDLRLQRLININEELAVATGRPTPALYVLTGSSGINAFTAGTTPEDMSICVTEGALLALKRAELQAVMAHEYGHIESGDVWRNTRMLFVLEAMVPDDYRRAPSAYLGFLRGTGAYVLAMVAITILTLGAARGVLAFTLVLAVIGIIIATILKGVNLFWLLGAAITRAAMCAVARVREFAADDAASGYTRDPEALASALRKIIGIDTTHLDGDAARGVAHMCIAPAVAGNDSGFYAAHPPVEERLRQLGFPLTREERERLEAGRATALKRYTLEVDYELNIVHVADGSAAVPDAPAAFDADIALTARPDLAASGKLLGTIPDELRRLLRTPAGACAAAEALIRDAGDAEPAADPTLTDTFRDLLSGLGAAFRLPLLQLATQGLRACDTQTQQALVRKLRGFLLWDERVSLREMVFFILIRRLIDGRKASSAIVDTSEAYAFVLGVAAHAFARDETDARAAFELGRDACFARATKLPQRVTGDFSMLEDALTTLATVSLERRIAARAGLARALSRDGRISLEELEFLRAVAAALALSLPPMPLPQPALRA